MNQKAATIQSSISISQFGEQKVKNNMIVSKQLAMVN
jgi:hypothetical protein